MRKQLFLSLFVLNISLLVLAGCGLSGEERKAFEDARLVFKYFPKSPDGAMSFFAGAYQDGTAVIGPNDMAFWVKDGKAYAVNQAAKEAAPELEQAPDNVHYDDAFIAATESE